MNTQEYLLDCLMEECAEIIQRASKANRFGLDEVQPGQDLTNRQRLIYEINDFIATVEVLFDERIESIFKDSAVLLKKQKLKKFMEYSREQGCLD